LTLITVFVMGCGKGSNSPAKIAETYRPQMQAVNQKLVALATSLDKAAPTPLPPKLAPPLVFRASTDAGTGNTVVLEWEALKDPASQEIGKIPPSDLLMGLYWLKNPISGDGDPKLMTKVFEAGVATRYAVVIRQLDSVEPKLLDAKTFQAGFASARIYVQDLTTDKLVGTIEIKATTPESIEFQYSTDQGANAAAMNALMESIRTDLKKQISSKLAAIGDVHFSY
jgi:hypothetical protein